MSKSSLEKDLKAVKDMIKKAGRVQVFLTARINDPKQEKIRTVPDLEDAEIALLDSMDTVYKRIGAERR